MNMDTNIAQLNEPIGHLDMTLLPEKDFYLVVERQGDGEMAVPSQILNRGGRSKVLKDLMIGYYGAPVMILRLYANGIWLDVSSSFATFWYCEVAIQIRRSKLPLPPFLETYLHAELRPDWHVNEAV